MSFDTTDVELLDLAQSAARGDEYCSSCSRLGHAVCSLSADLDTAETKLAQSDRKEIDRLHDIIRKLAARNAVLEDRQAQSDFALECARLVLDDLLKSFETDEDDDGQAALNERNARYGRIESALALVGKDEANSPGWEDCVRAEVGKDKP